MKRILCLSAVLHLVAASGVRAQSLLAEADDGGDLSELLRLSGSFWARLRGDEPGANPFESLNEGFQRYHMTPRIGGVVSGSGIGLGFTQTLWSDGRGAVRFAALGTSEGYFQLAILHEALLDRNGRWLLRSGFLHRVLAQEDFFGLGLETERLDRSDYSLRETGFGSELHYALSERVGMSLGADVRLVRSGPGENPSLPSLEIRFAPNVIPGYGESYAYGTLGASIYWDSRDRAGYPRRGSRIEGDFRQFLGLDSGDPRFRRFGIEVQNAIPLPGHDHGLVTRLRADWLDHGAETEVPFFLTRGLGGRHSLRGFPLNRFRGEDLVLATVEYRSAILPGKLDAVVFWDAGGAYRSFSELRVDRLEHSFGAGIRVLRRDRIVLRLEMARGSEGAQFLLSFSKPF
jgi:hypothetical protein